jgi:hypothetical protein
MMEAYFVRIDHIVNIPTLPSRLKYMLMDIIDLRRSRWVSKEANKGPKTLEEVRAEVCLRFTPLFICCHETNTQIGRGSSCTESRRERAQQSARPSRWTADGWSGRFEELFLQQPRSQPGRH